MYKNVGSVFFVTITVKNISSAKYWPQALIKCKGF
jgi:hypothetical protein